MVQDRQANLPLMITVMHGATKAIQISLFLLVMLLLKMLLLKSLSKMVRSLKLTTND